MTGDRTFLKITNKDIYEEMQGIRRLLTEFHEKNNQDHASIITRQDHTNGKVRLAHWIATTGLTFIVIVIGLLFNHMG